MNSWVVTGEGVVVTVAVVVALTLKVALKVGAVKVLLVAVLIQR